MNLNSVKGKLTIISILTILGFGIFIALIIYLSNMQIRYSNVINNLSNIEKDSLVLKELSKNIDRRYFDIDSNINKELVFLEKSMSNASLDLSVISNMQNEFISLKESFNDVYKKQEIIDSKRQNIENLKKSINDNFSDVSDYKLLYLLKNLESYENEFFLKGITNIKKFSRAEFKMRRSVRASLNFTTNKAKQKEINDDLIAYKKLFLSIVKDYDEIKNSKFAMEEIFTNSLENLKLLKKDIKKDVDNSIETLFYIILGFVIIIVLFEIFLVNFISKGIVNNLTKVKEGLNRFFDVLNQKTSEAELIVVNSKDEFYEIANEVNENIQKSVKLIVHNKEVLEEANDVLQKVGNGFYGYKIPHHDNVSPEIKNLIVNVNKMMDETKIKFDILNKALQAYGKYDFDYTVPKKSEKGLYGDFGTLIASTKLIGNNVAEFLAMIMNTGTKLNNQTEILSRSSNELSDTSNDQASSLEQTAAAVEQITSNIKGNTLKVEKMSNLANDLSTSSSKGKEYSSLTANAMDEISSEVSSINEAITVIDQIAFQTNILSLNAAVEAATAGEAGKGFAVVAQEVRNLAARSAEAAKEIKDLVENATLKASRGKEISQTMSNGYDELNSKIHETISLIEDVSSASKEQQEGMHQINDAVHNLDKNIQINSKNASYILELSNSIAIMSSDLLEASSKASFDEKIKKQVCDVNLVYKTAQIKNDQIEFKANIYDKVGDYNSWKIDSLDKSSLGKWILESERDGLEFITTNTWSEIKNAHSNIHKFIQHYVDSNAKKDDNKILREIAQNVESNMLVLFDKLNELKVINCELKQRA